MTEITFCSQIIIFTEQNTFLNNQNTAGGTGVNLCRKYLDLIGIPRWGTADAELKVPPTEYPELSLVLFLKPGVDQKWPNTFRLLPGTFLN